MRTTTERPLRRLVTRTLLPNGSERCAAVKPPGCARSPLAVRPPLYEYTEAIPDCAAAYRGVPTRTVHAKAKHQAKRVAMFAPNGCPSRCRGSNGEWPFLFRLGQN